MTTDDMVIAEMLYHYRQGCTAIKAANRTAHESAKSGAWECPEVIDAQRDELVASFAATEELFDTADVMGDSDAKP